MRITVTIADEALGRFAAGLQRMQKQAKVEMQRGLVDGGRKVLTSVRRALKDQTGVRRYATIVKNTRGYLDKGELEYHITATNKGIPITEFRVSAVQDEWDPKSQPRDERGRFAPVPDTPFGRVTADVWNTPHTFKRSFVHHERGFVARRPDGSLQRLFGPNLAKELDQDQSIAAFEREAPKVQDAIVKRLQALLTG